MMTLLASVATVVAVNPLMILPFAILLFSIALGPMLFEKWWHHNYPKVAVGLGLFTVLYYIFGIQNAGRLSSVVHEYVSFIALIGSLFVVAGGIHITVKGESTPFINTVFLFLGAVISNFIGTTGASMLLIRPWIRMNKYRITSFHIVFFIFIVSNVGGCLTPIGDPPLFLGYLKGVPFFWVFENLWPGWMLAMGMLLAIFLVLDIRNFHKASLEVREEMTASETWRFEGLHNIFFIAVVIAAVLLNKTMPAYIPELIMLAAAAASYFTTSQAVHESNDFNFEPIKEVAWLFVGIFATMVPALDYLELNAGEIGLHSPMQFYWATGALSAFLDNAPTYLTFLAAAMGDHHLSISYPEHVLKFIELDNHILIAISLAAVFFGAGTYIGNGPNFMVRNIALQFGTKAPGFFTYLFLFAVPILLPVYIVIAVLFFSRWSIF